MRVTMRLVEDAEREQAQKTWLNGGSALPLVSLHHRRGEVLEASAVARAALEKGDAEAVEIERLLYEMDDAPPDWIETLRAFAAAPSIERWRDLMRFVPPGQIYQRSRNTVRRLRQLGVDTNLLFLCATNLGMTPDAIQLVEEGLVDTAVILQRAEEAGGARATYLGLAATAAYLAGDLVGAIRLLRESAACENDYCSPLPHILFIRDNASAEVNAMLDQAAIPAI
jgi:hypothetical protein